MSFTLAWLLTAKYTVRSTSYAICFLDHASSSSYRLQRAAGSGRFCLSAIISVAAGRIPIAYVFPRLHSVEDGRVVLHTFRAVLDDSCGIHSRLRCFLGLAHLQKTKAWTGPGLTSALEARAGRRLCFMSHAIGPPCLSTVVSRPVRVHEYDRYQTANTVAEPEFVGGSSRARALCHELCTSWLLLRRRGYSRT